MDVNILWCFVKIVSCFDGCIIRIVRTIVSKDKFKFDNRVVEWV